jgi:hypothetical protein
VSEEDWFLDWLIGENRGEAWGDVFSLDWLEAPTSGANLPKALNSRIEEIGRRLPTDARDNGMHSWHAGTSAEMRHALGQVGKPLISLVGLFHESPLDSQFFVEERDQGTVNHLLDSVTDIVANEFGIAIGTAVSGDRGVELAITLGNYIPGPRDPRRGEEYGGNPSAAWGYGRQY